MIHKNLLAVESDWQKDLAMAFKRPQDLLAFLDLSANDLLPHFEATRLFPMIVPRFFASLMEKGNINDPLLRQVLPWVDEFEQVSGYLSDPLAEQSNPQRGMLHKYKNRVLILLKTACAVNCRYCFRRHFPYADNSISKPELAEILHAIQTNTDVDEVIISGGDPLMAKDKYLLEFIQAIESLSQIKRLRIHTRLPVVLPNRISPALIDMLTSTRLQSLMVLHINHANEVSTRLRNAVSELKSAGVRVLNQGVMLRGINDSVEAQCALNEALFDAGIQAYYMHLLDKVAGAAHFDIPEQGARSIMRGVQARQSGYMIPKLVREIAGEPNKTLIVCGWGIRLIADRLLTRVIHPSRGRLSA